MRTGTSVDSFPNSPGKMLLDQVLLECFKSPVLIVSLSAACPKHPKWSCVEQGCEQRIWKWSTHADVKKRRERQTHETQRRLTKDGEGGWGETDRHTNVHTNAHVHMNGAHEIAEKQTLFIRTPAVHIRERAPLTNAVCKQGCIHCPRQTGTQRVCVFCWCLCKRRSHSGVTTMQHNGAANKAAELLLMSQLMYVERVQRHALKSTMLHLGILYV